MLNSYGFRKNAIQGLLKEAVKFNRVSYISATPVDIEYRPLELRGFNELEIVWPNAVAVKTHRVRCSSPIKTTACLCQNRITDKVGANYHIFMNSVRGIIDIIIYAGLTSDDCRIVCAETSDNRKKIPEGFDISKPGDSVKTINFYTSTCFEGCDVYDENGRTYIVCDPNKTNTLLDISTSMLQICGRIRDSRYKDEMTLIFNTTRYEDVATVEDYEAKIKREVSEAKQIAAALNSTPQSFRHNVLARCKELGAPFITEQDGQVVIDENMINLDRLSYRIIHGYYNTQLNLDYALGDNNFSVVNRTWADSKYVGLMTIQHLSFKECCEQYAETKDKQGKYVFKEDEQLVRLRNTNPEACIAVDKLGIEEVRRMKYHKSNIRKKVLATSGLAQEVKIKGEVDRRLHKFTSYTIPEIKQTLSEIYSIVGLEKAPRATDLEK